MEDFLTVLVFVAVFTTLAVALPHLVNLFIYIINRKRENKRGNIEKKVPVPRDLNRLYEILCGTLFEIDFIPNINIQIEKLCDEGKITYEENEILQKNFKINRPSEKLHTDFYNHPLYNKYSSISKYLWMNGDYSPIKEVIIEQGRLFVQYLIKNHIVDDIEPSNSYAS